MRRRIGDLLACLALLALASACFARLVARPDALIVDGARPSIDYAMVNDPRGIGNDVTFLFLPHYQTITRQIARSGRLPFWDSSGFAGRPMIGNPQGGLFYPPVWLAWACRSPSALGWVTVAHLLWGGLGSYVLARGLGMERLAATVAGGCFQASPFILAQTFEGHYPHVWAAAWYPWAFWAFTEFRSGRLRGTFALPPILALVFLTGHPQEWYYLVFALCAWAACDALLIAWSGSRLRAVRKLAVWGGLIALSFGLVALELWPDLAAEAHTLKSGRLTLAQAARYTPHSVNLLQLLNPFALGGPADYYGHDNYWEQVISIGLVPLVLSLIALTRYPKRGQVAGWFALTAAATIFACGHKLVMFTLFYHWVPGMNRFRAPSRALFLAEVGAAMLAGFGVEALRSGALSAESWRGWNRYFLRAVAVLVLGLFAGQVFAWRLDYVEAKRPKPKAATVENAPDATKGVKTRVSKRAVRAEKDVVEDEKLEPHRGLLAVACICRDGRFWLLLGGTAAVLAYGCRAGRRRAAAWVLGTMALGELGMYGFELVRVTPAAGLLRTDPVSLALERARASVPGPFRIRARDSYFDDLHSSTHGFEKININDWFQVQRAADLYETLYPLFENIAPPPARELMGEALRSFGARIRQAVLDRLCVAFLISDHVDPNEPWPIEATGTWKDKTFAIHRNPTVLPRAYVVPRAYPTRVHLGKELALFHLIDPRAHVLMDRDPLGPELPRQSFTPAEWLPTDSDHVIVRVRTEAAGLLVVADTWLPGWTARVDGKRVPILQGNHTQRVVPLFEAGTHEILMTYRPQGLFPGVAISVLTTFLWLGCLVAARRRAARRNERESGLGTIRHGRYPMPHLDFERETSKSDGPG